jgi:hypothetical protein
MPVHPSVRRLAVAPLLGAILLALPVGCGGDEESDPVAVASDEARFDTAEALLARLNQIAHDVSVIDRAAVLDLFHVESEKQARLLAIARAAEPLLELDQALWDRFGRGMDPAATRPPLAPLIAPAKVTTTVGNRVAAVAERQDGTRQKLFLVETPDGWRISGYTLERDPAMPSDPALLDAMEQMNGYLSPFAPPITARVRQGEFANAAEAGVALGRLVAEKHPEVGRAPELMFGGRGPQSSAAIK